MAFFMENILFCFPKKLCFPLFFLRKAHYNFCSKFQSFWHTHISFVIENKFKNSFSFIRNKNKNVNQLVFPLLGCSARHVHPSSDPLLKRWIEKTQNKQTHSTNRRKRDRKDLQTDRLTNRHVWNRHKTTRQIYKQTRYSQIDRKQTTDRQTESLEPWK